MITAPASCSRWLMLICASPVPGGMSITSTSSGAQAVLDMNVSKADITCRAGRAVLRLRCGSQAWPSQRGVSKLPMQWRTVAARVAVAPAHGRCLHQQHPLQRSGPTRHALSSRPSSYAHHGPPPDGRHIRVHQKPHAHALDAIVGEGQHPLVCSRRTRAVGWAWEDTSLAARATCSAWSATDPWPLSGSRCAAPAPGCWLRRMAGRLGSHTMHSIRLRGLGNRPPAARHPIHRPLARMPNYHRPRGAGR